MIKLTGHTFTNAVLDAHFGFVAECRCGCRLRTPIDGHTIATGPATCTLRQPEPPGTIDAVERRTP